MICIQNGLILNLEILKKMALHIETELGKLKNIIIKIGIEKIGNIVSGNDAVKAQNILLECLG